MADNNDRIVFPDEVEAVKDAAAKSNVVQGGDSNSIEANASTAGNFEIETRNVITAPPNCPPGYKMGKDGVCREVFD